MSTITTTNPATGEIIKTYKMMSEAEAVARVEAAHHAFLEWRGLAWLIEVRGLPDRSG